MLFNSIEFLIFLPTVFLLYWKVLGNTLKIQNIFLLIVSYVFYGWWDYRFLILIFLSSLIDFWVGLLIEKNENIKIKKVVLMISIVVNLSLLGFFKYFNFFIDSFVNISSVLGFQSNLHVLNIILPVGISFYTFQSLSYIIDVYKGSIKANRSVINYLAYVSFFPQLVAGPIERAKHLLPQFEKKRVFNIDIAKDGLRQILWGLFKKVVIADNLASYVNQIFDGYQSLPGSILFLGLVYFAFQIYCDFSGYSDIAVGAAKLLGFDLMTNFNYPYFSKSIPEFWRRWHISLSTWFRDYIYFPLGGNRGKYLMQVRNILVVFIISGLWHGANWTYVFWGLLNAVYFMPSIFIKKNREISDMNSNNFVNGIKNLLMISVTFMLILISWTFFRSETLSDAFMYLGRMFSLSMFEKPTFIKYIPLIMILLVVEWFQQKRRFTLDISFIDSTIIRWAIYYLIIISILLFNTSKQTFIYFQF